MPATTKIPLLESQCVRGRDVACHICVLENDFPRWKITFRFASQTGFEIQRCGLEARGWVPLALKARCKRNQLTRRLLLAVSWQAASFLTACALHETHSVVESPSLY